MASLLSQGGRYHFESVKMGLEKAGVVHTANASDAILHWHDSLKEQDYYKNLKIWQVVNRIPSSSVLTRKASLAKLIERVKSYFPRSFSFIPKQYILPDQYDEFVEMLKTTDKTWIVKPDEGSLGLGIQIIEPGQEVEIMKESAVAQEYIDSLPLDNKKFDLRIYVLVSSIKPLKIFVYRDGLARFCSEEIGEDPIYSRLTNVTLNKEHDSDFKHISRLISDVFPILQEKKGININKLWSDIDDVIIKTILSSINLLTKAEQTRCPPCVYNRCFQIFGFDILLDKNAKPYVLEVNYRPNLDYHRGCERRMKSQMICDAIKIACPLKAVQSSLLARRYVWDKVSWRRFMANNEDIKKAIKGERDASEQSTNFKLIYQSDPSSQTENNRIYNTVISLPVTVVPGFELSASCLDGGEA